VKYGRVRRELSEPCTQIFSKFVHTCRERGIKCISTPEVLEQIPGVIIRKINEEFDRLGIRGFAIRRDIIRKLMRNLDRFKGNLEVFNIEVDSELVEKVREFYSKPEFTARLEKLRSRKNRETLIPEESDMEIISQAIRINNESLSIDFISGDGDFIHFSEEIEGEFGICVIAVADAYRVYFR